MTGPLIVLAILAAFGGFGFFARHFLALPIEKEAAFLVPVLAFVALIVGSGLAIALYRNRESEPIDVEVLRDKFYFDEFYAWLINWTQELLARVSRFLRSLDHRYRRRAMVAAGDLGTRRTAPADPGRKPAGLLVSLRARHRWPHLLHRFPLMLLFIIFCPIVAAILIMVGAPARKTAFGASVLALAAALLLFVSFDQGQHDFQLVTSLCRSSPEWRLEFHAQASTA